MMMHHDEDEAIRRGTEGANFFGYSLGHFYVFGEHQPGKTDVWSQYVERRAAQGYDPDAIAAAVRAGQSVDALGAKQAAGDTTGLRGSVGTPAQVREYLRRFEEAGVDQVIFVLQAGRNQHEHIMESIEIFGREVLPEFIDRDEAQVKAKQQRLAPAIEAAMQRTSGGLPTRGRRRLLVPRAAGAMGQGDRFARVGGDLAAVGRRSCRRQTRSRRRHHRLRSSTQRRGRRCGTSGSDPTR